MGRQVTKVLSQLDEIQADLAVIRSNVTALSSDSTLAQLKGQTRQCQRWSR